MSNATQFLFTDATGKDIAAGIHAIASALGAEAKLSFKRLQQIIRAGEIDNYMAIGDEIEVEKETGLSISVHTTGSLTATITEATWNQHVEHLHHGVYEFTYDGYEWNNNELGEGLDLAFYGINVSGTAAEGDVIAVTVATTTLVFQYVAKDKVTLRNPTLTHSAVFQLKNIYANRQFAAAEAIIYASAAMPAGTYHFNLYKPGNIYYLNAALHNKDVQFTTTVDIPAGGQLVLTTGSFKDSTSVSALKLTSYSSRTSTTALESNIACSEGTSGTDLGNANTAANNTKINSTDRCVYGSNNWKQSNLRCWLNTNAGASSWWSPQGPFSRPTGSGITDPSCMYGIEKDFLDVLQEVATPTTQNWFDGGTTVTTYDKFFIPSNSQVYFTASGAEGDNWDYYKDFSDLSSPGTGADSNRIKTGGSNWWWTRTPSSGSSHVECLVSTGGSWNNNNANNTSGGVAPACCIA